jgi:hypothetical protein
MPPLPPLVRRRCFQIHLCHSCCCRCFPAKCKLTPLPHTSPLPTAALLAACARPPPPADDVQRHAPVSRPQLCNLAPRAPRPAQVYQQTEPQTLFEKRESEAPPPPVLRSQLLVLMAHPQEKIRNGIIIAMKVTAHTPHFTRHSSHVTRHTLFHTFRLYLQPVVKCDWPLHWQDMPQQLYVTSPSDTGNM